MKMIYEGSALNNFNYYVYKHSLDATLLQYHMPISLCWAELTQTIVIDYSIERYGPDPAQA